MSAKRENIQNPTEEQIAELLQSRTPMVRDLYIDTHRLVLQTLPDVEYATECSDGGTWYGTRQYGYDGWGMAALAGHTKWVSLMFNRGADLDDPDGILEGTGKKMRHVKLRSPEQFNERLHVLRTMITAASKLNER